jgi:hypothetical protein
MQANTNYTRYFPTRIYADAVPSSTEGFTLVFWVYCFDPRSSVESVVNHLFDNC